MRSAFAGFLVLASAVVLAAGPLALAAELPGAASSLSLEAAAPQGLRPGATGPGSLTVTFSGEGFACAQAATLTVALAVDESRAADGVVLLVDNATALALPQGVWPPGQPVTASAGPNLTLLVARYAAPGSTSTFTIRATVAKVEPAAACTLDSLPTLVAEQQLLTKLAEVPPGDPAFHPEHEEHGGFVFDKVVKPGETYSWTPTEPGRYPYHDHFRPEQKGLVRVLRVAEGAAAPILRITKDGFLPSDVAVKVGSTVTWRNEDTIARTVSADEQHDATPVVEPEDAQAAQRANATGPGSAATPGFSLAAGAGAALLVGAASRRACRR